MRKVVIVTGGAAGIGRAYCRGLAEEGYRLVVADITDATDVVEEAEELGTEAVAVRTDVSDPESTEAMAAAALDAFGRIDGLVNNAGYFSDIHKTAFDQIDIQEWDKAFAVNVRGTWLCCKAVVPTMKAQRAGKIVNTSSMTVPSGIPHFLHYVSSKAAIVGLTRGLARELGEYGIAVNTITPDYIPHNADYAGRQPEMAGLIAAQRCFKRDQTPEDMVGTLLYLMGPGSDFVTGQQLYVNGGRLFT